MSGGTRRRACAPGQSLVEFALFAPLFFLIVLGAGDLARVFYYSVALQNVAREGARHGAYFDPYSGTNTYDDNTDIVNTVKNEASYIGAANLSQPEPPGTAGACPGSGAPYAPPYGSSLFPAGNPNSGGGTGYIYVCFNNDWHNTTSGPGQPIRVAVLYTFNPMTPLLWTFLGNNGYIQVVGSAEFIVEGP